MDLVDLFENLHGPTLGLGLLLELTFNSNLNLKFYSSISIEMDLNWLKIITSCSGIGMSVSSTKMSSKGARRMEGIASIALLPGGSVSGHFIRLPHSICYGIQGSGKTLNFQTIFFAFYLFFSGLSPWFLLDANAVCFDLFKNFVCFNVFDDHWELS